MCNVLKAHITLIAAHQSDLMFQASSIINGKLVPPEEFPFPFKPYDIQREFMRELYTTLEEGRIGLFESPTGTVPADLLVYML